MLNFNRKQPELSDSSKKDLLSFLEKKQLYFEKHISSKERKKWYFEHYVYYHYRLRQKPRIEWLIGLKLPLHLSFVRWMIVDFMRGKSHRFKDIYLFVGLPGEGKTISMVAHIERALEKHPNLVIATNFHYANESSVIEHWIDIIKVALDANKHRRPCLIAIDEVQNTFDATEWKNFPGPLYSLLSFNRKLNLQFLCSAQIYERIPSKIRQLANYTVICKNVWKADRYFVNYYFEKIIMNLLSMVREKKRSSFGSLLRMMTCTANTIPSSRYKPSKERQRKRKPRSRKPLICFSVPRRRTRSRNRR